MLLTYTKAKGVIAGCDEAGRGCLAGPVVAAAVILPQDFYHPMLNDSKQVNKANRNALRSYIEDHALAYAVGMADINEIDKINILNASILAMHRALDQLSVKFNHIIVDGNRFKSYKKMTHECVIKGDNIYTSIAAASILAKTYRDEHVEKLHNQFPHYQWIKNKTYATAQHIAAIRQHGYCEHHRKSFHLKSKQLSLF
ncbi:MAG: ribonuclease HII [Bacteroidetes bacterium]|nr:ribonuclease HII [Bacteroidota bacterium]